jgi:hypothetical protein
MSRWEICEVETCRAEEDAELLQWVAKLYMPDGDPTIVKKGEGWYAGNQDFPPRFLTRIVAALGRDGWEPIPMVEMSGYQGSTSSSVRWIFKRPLPGE